MEIHERDVIKKLKALIKEMGSQTAVADSFDMSLGFINDVLHRRKPVSPDLALKLGFERKVVFEKIG